MRFTARPRVGGRHAAGGIFDWVSRPAPGWGGVAPWGDGVVVVLVMADPLWGAGPAYPAEGEGGDEVGFSMTGRPLPG